MEHEQEYNPTRQKAFSRLNVLLEASGQTATPLTKALVDEIIRHDNAGDWPTDTSGKPQVVVVDRDNEGVVGPFDSEEEAAAYFIELARSEGWSDTIDLIDQTGSPFGHVPNGGIGFGLYIDWITAPVPSIRMKALIEPTVD